jgi:hypothetical protein
MRTTGNASNKTNFIYLFFGNTVNIVSERRVSNV